jgi:hypothetical protein
MAANQLKRSEAQNKKTFRARLVPIPKQENLIKVHVSLDKRDYTELQRLFSANIGASHAIRIAITRFLAECGDEARRIIDKHK